MHVFPRTLQTPDPQQTGRGPMGQSLPAAGTGSHAYFRNTLEEPVLKCKSLCVHLQFILLALLLYWNAVYIPCQRNSIKPLVGNVYSLVK